MKKIKDKYATILMRHCFRIPPYLDSCFFINVFFSLLPVGIVFLVYTYGGELFYHKVALFGYFLVIALFVSMLFLHKRRAYLIDFKYAEDVKRLSQDKDKFQLAVEHAAEHIVITDADGILLYANKSVEAITGYTRKEIMGKKAGSGELWGGLMTKSLYRLLWKTIKEDKKVFRGEVKNHRKNGEEYFAAVSIAPVLDKQGNPIYFVGIERDITQEKESDWVKTEFVSLASHQLRAPLTSIAWNLEMLMEEDGEAPFTPRQKKLLGEVEAGRKIMAKIVGTLLNVSRVELGRFRVTPKLTDLVLLIERNIAEVKRGIDEKKLSVHFDHTGDFSKYPADPVLFSILVDNLLSNAVKYNREGGSIYIRLEKNSSSIRLSIRDTGIGIPVGERKRIFEKMFRAENAKSVDAQGNGLGLYMVQEIARRCGGDITFESQEEVGTIFILSLPSQGMSSQEGSRQLISYTNPSL